MAISVEGELTGRRRYRAHRPHLGCILEVEETVFVTTKEDKPGRWVCAWRMATLADLDRMGETVV